MRRERLGRGLGSEPLQGCCQGEGPPGECAHEGCGGYYHYRCVVVCAGLTLNFALDFAWNCAREERA